MNDTLRERVARASVVHRRVRSRPRTHRRSGLVGASWSLRLVMKRSPLRRSKPLPRSGKGSGRRNGIRPVRRAGNARWDGVEWQRRVFAEHGRSCLGCGAPATDAHHICYRQVLRRELPDQPDAETDVRNGLPLCRQCHANHHARRVVLPVSVLPAALWEFAAGAGLVWWVERFYQGEKGERDG